MRYCAAFCCAVLSVCDAKEGRIPNIWALLFSMTGLAWSFLSDGLPGLADSLVGAAGMFVLLWLLYTLRLMGAGDVKLFMMLGVFYRWPGVLYVFAASVMAGSVYAVIRFWRKKDAKKRFLQLASYLEEIHSGGKPESYIRTAGKDARVSFAVFAALGALAVSVFGIG